MEDVERPQIVDRINNHNNATPVEKYSPNYDYVSLPFYRQLDKDTVFFKELYTPYQIFCYKSWLRDILAAYDEYFQDIFITSDDLASETPVDQMRLVVRKEHVVFFNQYLLNIEVEFEKRTTYTLLISWEYSSLQYEKSWVISVSQFLPEVINPRMIVDEVGIYIKLDDDRYLSQQSRLLKDIKDTLANWALTGYVVLDKDLDKDITSITYSTMMDKSKSTGERLARFDLDLTYPDLTVPRYLGPLIHYVLQGDIIELVVSDNLVLLALFLLEANIEYERVTFYLNRVSMKLKSLRELERVLKAQQTIFNYQNLEVIETIPLYYTRSIYMDAAKDRLPLKYGICRVIDSITPYLLLPILTEELRPFRTGIILTLREPEKK